MMKETLAPLAHELPTTTPRKGIPPMKPVTAGRPNMTIRCNVLGRTADESMLIESLTRKGAAIEFARHYFNRQRMAGAVLTDPLIVSANGCAFSVSADLKTCHQGF